MACIFEYTDYRKFLREFLNEAKGKRPELSHRFIQQKMGISSTGFVANVIAGKKNLSNGQIAKMAKILKLNRAEARYFECLVWFGQGKTVEEKNEYLLRMRMHQPKQLRASQMTVFAKWYYVAVREVMNYWPLRGDFAQLGAQLNPPVSAEQAAEAMKVLCGLGLLAKQKDGSYRQADAAVSSGDEVRSAELARFQLDTMDMAKRALDKTPAELRDISTLTFTVSQDTFGEVKREVQLFRKHLSAVACATDKPDRVYQCNIQLFPMTRTQGGSV